LRGGAPAHAILPRPAAARTHHLAAAGSGTAVALTGGYHLAFVIGAIFAVCGAAVGALLLRDAAQPVGAHGVEPVLESA
jgi:hypothetical protein